MGHCATKKSQYRLNYDLAQKFDEEPTDTASLSPGDFPSLQFHSLLTKLKLKRCVLYKKLRLKMDFAGFQELQMKPKYLVNDTARWQIEHLVQFSATEYEIRKKFIFIHIIEDQSTIIGTLKINLYLLATGPYHQDFSVPLPQSPKTRLSFNIKIAQIVGIQLKVNQIKFISKERQFPGDRFAFLVRSIVGDVVQETPPSYCYQVSFKNQSTYLKSSDCLRTKTNEELFKNTSDKIFLDTKTKETNSSSIVKIKDGQTIFREIFWSSQISKQMPQVKLSAPLYNLHSASFNIVFQYFTQTSREFSSQCFISLNKLMNFPSVERKDGLTSIIWQDRDIEIQVKTFDHGKQSGRAVINLIFSIQKHIKQMQICVRTQKGILETSPAFSQSSNLNELPEQLQMLQKLGKQIQNIFIEASNSPTIKINAMFRSSRYLIEINKLLKRQIEILMNTEKQSKLMFVYRNEKALLKGQRQLIELGFRTKALINSDKQQITASCWQLLTVLIKRGELTLEYIGFSTNQIEQYLSGQLSQFVKKKIEVSISFHKFMVDLLNLTFLSLQSYNCQTQRQFAELFCAYAYFRIPRFRTEVLSAITRQNDPEIEEWRGTQFNLTGQESQVQIQGKSVYSLMFDWQNHFYKILNQEQSYVNTQEKLSELLIQNQWEKRMRKRGGAFFAFVRYWVSYVEAIAVNSKHIVWRYFPGYNKLLHSFLAEMKNRKIQCYSQPMKKAASSLLSNQKLLNPFVLIIFRKTNCNDRIAVLNAFSLVNLFFTSITSRGRSLPSTFDLKLFLKAIQITLQGYSVVGMGRALLILYDHFKILPVEFRVEVSFYLLTKVFFKLFLHWCPNLRRIFHHLLFIRIYHQASLSLNQLNVKDRQIYQSNPEYRSEIIHRYNKLIVILQNAEESSHRIRKIRIDVYENQLHRKIKKKILEKRRPITNQSSYLIPKLQTQLELPNHLMKQLSVPRLQRYSSEIISRNLKVAVQSIKMAKKEQVIIRMKKQQKAETNSVRKRKLSFFTSSLQNQLVPLKQDEIIYVRQSLQQFHKVNQFFIKHLEDHERNCVPLLKLEMALDEKQIRPQGYPQYEEW